jgi:hypothetical protein
MQELVRIKDCLERDLSSCVGTCGWLVCNWGDAGWNAQYHPCAGQEPVAGCLFTRPIGYWAEWACFADRTPALNRFRVHAANAGRWLAMNRPDRGGTFMSPSACNITSAGEIDWLAAVGRWSAEPQARGRGLDRYFWHEGRLLPYSWDLNRLAEFSGDERTNGLIELATDWEQDKPRSHVVEIKDLAVASLAFIDYLVETQPQVEERWRRMIDASLAVDSGIDESAVAAPSAVSYVATSPYRPKASGRRKRMPDGQIQEAAPAYLDCHHEREGFIIGNPTPVVAHKMAFDLKCSAGVLSNWFKENFGGHAHYVTLCNRDLIGQKLHSLSEPLPQGSRDGQELIERS